MKLLMIVSLVLLCVVQGRSNKSNRIQAELETILDHVDWLKQDINDYTRQDPTGKKPKGKKPTGPKPTGLKPTGSKPTGLKPSGPKPSGPKPSRPKPTRPKPSGPRPSGPKPSGPKPTRQKPTGQHPTRQDPGHKLTGDPWTMNPTPEHPQKFLVPKMMMCISLKMKVSQLYWYVKSLKAKKMEPKGQDGNKMMKGEMPKSSFYDIMLDLIKSTYWQAKKMKAIGEMMSNGEKSEMEVFHSKTGPVEDRNEKEESKTMELDANSIGKLYQALQKMCSGKEMSENQEEKVKEMFENFEKLQWLYMQIKKSKETYVGGMEGKQGGGEMEGKQGGGKMKGKQRGGEMEGKQGGGEMKGKQRGGEMEGQQGGGEMEGKQGGGEMEGQQGGGEMEGKQGGGEMEGKQGDGEMKGKQRGGEMEGQQGDGDRKRGCTDMEIMIGDTNC